jgi:ATP/maltotriose-dependent transcriptional regulator MalT
VIVELKAQLFTEDTFVPEQANWALPDPLSPRELEVLTLIADGLTNREIAGRLFVGVSTVKKHIQHIYAKLDTRNRTGTIVRARELDLIP